MPWGARAWGEPETILDVVHGAPRVPPENSTRRSPCGPPRAPHLPLLGAMPPRKDALAASTRSPLPCSDASGQLLEAMVKSCMPSPSPSPSPLMSAPDPFSHTQSTAQGLPWGAPGAPSPSPQLNRAWEPAPRRQGSEMSVPHTPQANLSVGRGLGTGGGLSSSGSLGAGVGGGRGRESQEEEHQFTMLQQLVRAAGSAQALGAGCSQLGRLEGECQPISGGAADPSPANPPLSESPLQALLPSGFNDRSAALLPESPYGTPSAACWRNVPRPYTPLAHMQRSDSAVPAPEDATRVLRTGGSLGTGTLAAASLGVGSLGTSSGGPGSLSAGSLVHLQRELLRQGSGMTEDSVAWECRGGTSDAPPRASASASVSASASASQGQQRESPQARPRQLTGASSAGPSLTHAPQPLGLQQKLEFSAVAISSFLDGPFPHARVPGSRQVPIPSEGAPGTGLKPSLAPSVSTPEQMLRALLNGAPGSSQGFLPQLSPLGSSANAGLVLGERTPAVEGARKRQALASASAGSCRYTSDTSTELTGCTGGQLSLDETRARMAHRAAAFQARLLGGMPARSVSGDVCASLSQGRGSEGSGGGGAEGAGQMDEKKRRRLAANREAARRMRKRHAERVVELEAQVAELRRLHRQTSERLQKANEQVARLESANARLEHSAHSLSALDSAPGANPTASTQAQAQGAQGDPSPAAAPPAGTGTVGVPKAGSSTPGCKEEPQGSEEEDARGPQPQTGTASSARASNARTLEGGTRATGAAQAPQGHSPCSAEGAPVSCPAPAPAPAPASGGVPNTSGPQLQALGAMCEGLALGELGDMDTEGLLSAFGADECMHDFSQMHELSQMRFFDDMH